MISLFKLGNVNRRNCYRAELCGRSSNRFDEAIARLCELCCRQSQAAWNLRCRQRNEFLKKGNLKRDLKIVNKNEKKIKDSCLVQLCYHNLKDSTLRLNSEILS